MNIIITGANQGIGYYMAKEFLENNHNVTVLDMETDHIKELQNEFPNNLLILNCDVTKDNDMTNAVEQSVQKFEVIDIAIHNACICTFTSLEDTSYETYNDVFNVNYLGGLRLSKLVLPYMKERKSGRILYTVSGVGVTGFYNISPYASSKGALESLAKCLNLEYYDHNISFHLLHPPLTQTKSADPLPIPKEMKQSAEKVGRGLAKNINKKSFVICHSSIQSLQMKICYHFPLKMGKMMSTITKRSQI